MLSKYAKHVDEKKIISIVSDLVRENTVNPPGNEHRVKDVVTRLMKELGMEVSYYEKKPGRTNVVGKLMRGSGKKSLGFVSHMDTVPPGERELWTSDPFEPVLRGRRLYGRGALDDKGSFAAVYSAVRAFLAECGGEFDGVIYLIAAADEETGSELGVIYLVEEVGLRFDAGIIPDAGKLHEAVYGEKGVVQLELVSKGVQAHGSTPELGRNALLPLACVVDALRDVKLGEKWHEEFDGWTMNVGVVEGGSAANIVPARARAAVDFRIPEGLTLDDVLRAVGECIAAARGRYDYTDIDVKVTHQSTPHIVDKNAPIVRNFETARKRLGMPMKYVTIGGNTVAKNLYEVGIPCITHYPGNDELAHAPNEYADIDDLMAGSVLYAETLEEYFRKNN
ncbi:MAG: hypothetical protein A3F54_04970 [Candidatus Kerfeldbacteria bacterium RIFCSPHIGHO2_12_FULL_48_17]|uniref:Probable succinyl-diaminopimelate desuccinylase n=1 Tax=Candidatus Kerfeldbacteria bacterium RIFCSPHIGHO2_12_FULL_48_17 TaxID=1798542 RepID=A0A1G2B640_9BACT|nr:MAG: hypothetical protein A3F54_04970 [Candidatus Kerfeldbacteria bacterium RIFCSPHIGHO2_12_FULL_48_17]